MACVCGNEGSYETCCAPYHRGEALPPTAEALMRSRYSAYVKGEIDYILQTHDPETREVADREEIERWSREADWKGLEIHRASGGPGDEKGEVEFTASWREAGRDRTHRECSHFRPGEGGGWNYVSGHQVQVPVVAGPKTGRNDPCPCGSGKKFKKCCAA
ncbi:YchJ family protein [Vulgatibacter sp.]|uniref:YchJ family protein n=1 Tax=Vulgatibacter sp. TaxID=1971226 RepID=UPI003561B9E7